MIHAWSSFTQRHKWLQNQNIQLKTSVMFLNNHIFADLLEKCTKNDLASITVVSCMRGR